MQSRSKKAICYAVACGVTPGVYFSWDEAKENVIGFKKCIYKGFQNIADAKRFLLKHKLMPVKSGGWISTDGSPIIYKAVVEDTIDEKRKSQDCEETSEDQSIRGKQAYTLPEKSESARIMSNDVSPDLSSKLSESVEKSLSQQQSSTMMTVDDDISEDESNHYVSLPKVSPSTADQKPNNAYMGKNESPTGISQTFQDAINIKKEIFVSNPPGVATANLSVDSQTLHSGSVKAAKKWNCQGYSKVDKENTKCYAVACGVTPGIYFSWDEASKNVLGFSNSIYKVFQNTDEAKDFLISHKLIPVESSTSVSTNGTPIIFTPKSTRNKKQKSQRCKRRSEEVFVLDYKGVETDTVPIGERSDATAILSNGESPTKKPLHFFDACVEKPVKGFFSSNSNDLLLKKRTEPANELSVKQEIIDLANTDDENSEAESEPETEPSLDPIQQKAIDAAMNGRNIFLTGVAGTGKSFVTQKIVEHAKNIKHEVAVAAPTGVAAVNLNLGAQTVHSLAGVKVPQRVRDFGTIFSKVNKKKWKRIEMLVIDEIGMMTADFLDWLDVHVRTIRKQPLYPFGGIQLIFVGDFAQLGPVPGGTSLQNRAYKPSDEGADCFLNIKECTAYAFQSVMWREANFCHVHLKKVYRQNDQEFIQALMDLRESRVDSELVDNLVSNCRSRLETRPKLKIPEGIKPTVLYCTNAKVDRENYENLRLLNTERKCFVAKDTVIVDSDVPLGARGYVEELLWKNNFFNQAQAPKELELKVGAQVMLLHNLDTELVNGSRGVIKSFRLVPVAKNIQGIESIIGPDDHEKFPGRLWEELKYGVVLDFENQKWKIFKMVKYPLVAFMNGREKIIVQAPFERSLYRQGICRRLQVPLRLAWAITIHKSQGSTLDLVVCDLKGCFTTGQAYVALSRAKTMNGLQILNFEPSRVMTDSLVEGFYRALEEDRMIDFLEEEAGLWWFPVLEAADWLNMFKNAKSSQAREASMQFRRWIEDYSPHEGYQGWKGFTDNAVPTDFRPKKFS